jgi:hypothetical protein
VLASTGQCNARSEARAIDADEGVDDGSARLMERAKAPTQLLDLNSDSDSSIDMVITTLQDRWALDHPQTRMNRCQSSSGNRLTVSCSSDFRLLDRG